MNLLNLVTGQVFFTEHRSLKSQKISSPNRKLCVTRKNSHVLLIISQFMVFGSSDKDMKARNGKLQATLSLLTEI